VVYTRYFSQFSAIEGFDLNLSFICPLQNAIVLAMGFCRSARFSASWWFLRAVMDLLEGKAGSGGICLGTRGVDRLACLCRTRTSRDLNVFLREIWERSCQLIQLLEGPKRRDGGKGACRGGIIIIVF